MNQFLYVFELKLFVNDNQLKMRLQTVEHFSKDIKMEFERDKYTNSIFHEGKLSSSHNMTLKIKLGTKRKQMYFFVLKGEGFFINQRKIFKGRYGKRR